MTEQTITPIFTPLGAATGLLEEARIAHEKYLIKQQDSDLERAIECYIDAIKNNIMPTKEGFYEPSEVFCELMELPSAQPKGNLIDKASVCEILADMYPFDGEEVIEVKCIDEAYEAICNLPSAIPRPDHGYMWICPECGLPVHSDDEKCPRCGWERRT